MFTGLWVIVCSAGTDLAEPELFASPEVLAEEATIEAGMEELKVDDAAMVLLWPALK